MTAPGSADLKPLSGPMGRASRPRNSAIRSARNNAMGVTAEEMEQACDLFAGLGRITSRRMFGGPGL